MAQLVKNPPAMWETWVRSLGWEDPLEKGMATHSSILAWRIPQTIVHGVAKRWTQLSDFHFHFSLFVDLVPILHIISISSQGLAFAGLTILSLFGPCYLNSQIHLS